MYSTQETLIAIASASQRAIDALVLCKRDRNDRNLDLSCKRLEGDLHRIVAASQTLLTDTLQCSSADPVVDDRLEMWLSSREPKTCIDVLQEVEALIKSNSNGVTSILRNIFLPAPIDNKFKRAIRIFEKNRIYFYFLLNTNVWNQESATVGRQKGHPMNTQGIKQGLVDRNTTSVELSWTKKIWSETDRARMKEILEWLHAWDCTEKHEDTLELRQPDTCTWLPETYEYETWKHANDAFLWLHGKPGSGKSVLAASTIDGIQNTMVNGELLAYFYCDFRSEWSTVAAEVMRSLLSQLLEGLCDLGVDPGDTLDVLDREKRQKHRILDKSKRLAVLVSRVAKRCPRPPLVVVDALDECEDIENLLDSLLHLNEDAVRMLVISRPLQVIKYRFSGLPCLSLEQMSREVHADIILHVRREVDSHSRLRDISTILKEEIIEKLCRKADGMFRWIECQLNTLKSCFTAVEIREVLDSLPIGLDATHRRILLMVSKEDRGGAIAKRALMWIVAAVRPLRLCQIVDALSIDLDLRTLSLDFAPAHGRALLDSLSSLIIHSEETDVVRLSHFSVKEYLVGKFMKENHGCHINLRDAHAQVAQQCMGYIAACLSLKLHDSDECPLLDYVLDLGFYHLSNVEPTDWILDSIVTLDRDIQQHPSEWERLRGNGDRADELPSVQDDFSLYILIRYAPDSLLRLLLSRPPVAKKEGINPLTYVVPGKIEHAHTLLEHGAKLGIPGGFIQNYGPFSGLPIEAAVESCDEDLVDLFLEEGSPVPHTLFSIQFLGRSESDHWSPGSIHILTRLLQTDEFMEWAIDAILNKTLLIPALHGLAEWLSCRNYPAEGDMVVMARRFKQIDWNLAGHTSFVKSLLRNAANIGDISGIQHLLSDLKMQLPPDILLDKSQFFYEQSNAETIRFLIQNGVNPHVVPADESTALHYTARGCVEKTKVLCEAGCSPSVRNLRDETPMHIAVERGNLSVVGHLLSVGAFLPPDILLLQHLPSSMIRFLIREGADAQVVAANGDSVLHSALCYGWIDDFNSSVDRLESVRMLVAAGCDPCVTNSFGRTSLDIAVANGHISVVKYLLSLNIPLSPDILLSLNMPPYPDTLQVPARTRRILQNPADFAAMVRLLLKQGADPSMTTPGGDSALHLAMSSAATPEDKTYRVVETLVAAGCDPFACNANGRTVLHTAAARGWMKIVEYLLSLGVVVPSDIFLFLSFGGSTIQVIQSLIDKGADVRAVTADGETPLHRALGCSFQHRPDDGTQIIQLLIEKGADVRAATADGNTPLHCAVSSYPESSSLKFTELLIAAGSEPRAFNVTHKTPMHVAAAKGRISVINYLLSLNVPLPQDILLSKITTHVLRFLIDKGADTSAVTTEGDTALHFALARSGFGPNLPLEAAKILIEAGCDINACNSAGHTPVHSAASYGHLDAIKYLLSRGASLSPDVFLAAAKRGDIDTMQYLLSQGTLVPSGAILAATSCTARLPFTSNRVRLRAILFLSTLNGADIHVVAPNGDTALHCAVQFGYWEPEEDFLETAKVLVQLGCHLSLRNSAGETPIHIAARRHQISVVKYLLSQGAPLPSDVLLPAVSFIDTFVYELEVNSEAAMIRFLIREGANPCAVSDKGDTPLHVFLRHGSHAVKEWKIVQMLLDAGANPYARNLDGQTPVDLAEKWGPFFAKNFMRLVNQAKAPIIPRHS